jgi:hypothetical protein
MVCQTVTEATYSICQSGPDHGIRGKGGKVKRGKRKKYVLKRELIQICKQILII